MPVIVLSSTASSTPYVVQSPSPSDSDIAEHWVRFKLGHHSRPITPGGLASNYFGDTWIPTTAPPTLFDPDDLWDNLTIPYSAYFPMRTGSSDYRTPPPDAANYPSINYWDQPIQNRELTPKPVPAIEEPIAGPSQPHRSAWQNCDKQCLTPPTFRADLPLHQFSESVRFRRWPSEVSDSDTATELLPKAEYVNGIHGGSPKLSPIPSIHSLYTTNPDPPTDDAI